MDHEALTNLIEPTVLPRLPLIQAPVGVKAQEARAAPLAMPHQLHQRMLRLRGAAT